MTGWWVVGFVLVTVLLLVLAGLLVGTMREVVLLRRAVQQRNTGKRRVTPVEEDGPPIGSPMPHRTWQSANGHGVVRTGPHTDGKRTLVVFLAPSCEGCQQAVPHLNEVIRGKVLEMRGIAFLRGSESACRSFINLFPLDMPVVIDEDAEIHTGFHIHNNPAGLLYDETGSLERVGILDGRDALAALLGDASVSTEGLANVFPRPKPALSAGNADRASVSVALQ